MREHWQEASDLIGPVQHRHSAVERLLRIDVGDTTKSERDQRLATMGRTLREMDLENDWRQLQPEQLAEERKRQEANVRTARRALTRIQAIEVLHKPDDTRTAPYNAASKAFEGATARESVSDTAHKATDVKITLYGPQFLDCVAMQCRRQLTAQMLCKTIRPARHHLGGKMRAAGPQTIPDRWLCENGSAR